LTLDGRALCWGDASADVEGPFRQISAGHARSCGVTQDAELRCWSSGQRTSSPLEGSYAQVAVGLNHACALSERGYAACWGMSYAGQLSAPEVPYTSIDASGPSSFTCGITEEGHVRCWDDEYFEWLKPPPELAGPTANDAG
jgi:hypothetical protein